VKFQKPTRKDFEGDITIVRISLSCGYCFQIWGKQLGAYLQEACRRGLGYNCHLKAFLKFIIHLMMYS